MAVERVLVELWIEMCSLKLEGHKEYSAITRISTQISDSKEKRILGEGALDQSQCGYKSHKLHRWHIEHRGINN